MANLTETSTFDAGVYQIETTDPVSGGAAGIANKPLINLANRTKYLKDQVDAILAGTATLTGYAKIASPAFTGNPTAPTPALGDDDTSLATTAFVQDTIGGTLSKSVAGGSNVTLTAVEAGNGILYFSGALTANIAVILPALPTRTWLIGNGTTGAFTLTVKTASGTGIVVTQGLYTFVYSNGTSIFSAETDILSKILAVDGAGSGIDADLLDGSHGSAYAKLASPALTGTPTAPTATVGSTGTQLATLDFVNAEIAKDAPSKTGSGASGTWPISISGTAAVATVGNRLACPDTRATNPLPIDLSEGIIADFKNNTANGLADGGTYNGVISFRPYSSGSDVSGGPSHQLAFTANGNIWHRYGTAGSAWNAWQELLDSVNYNDFAPSKTGTGASGTWGINISGNAATATTCTNWNGIPSGTAMLFAQTAAPTGWTKSTAHNDKALRVVSGTAGSGGTVAFSSAFVSQAVSGSIGSTTTTGSVGNTTLSAYQMPVHSHPAHPSNYGAAQSPGYSIQYFDTTAGWSRNTGNEGGGGSHTHSLTMNAHNHSFTGTAINMAVQYVDVIIATKN